MRVTNLAQSVINFDIFGVQLNARSGRLQFQQYAKITIRVVRVNRLLYQFARSSSNGHGYSELLSGGQSEIHILAQ